MEKTTLYYEAKKILGYFEQNILQKLGESYATSITVKTDRFYRYAKVDTGDDAEAISAIVFVSPSKINFRYGKAKNAKSDMEEVVFYTFSPKDNHDEVLKSFKKNTRIIQRMLTEDATPPTVETLGAFLNKYGKFQK